MKSTPDIMESNGNQTEVVANGEPRPMSLSTHAIHADDVLNNIADVAPALHVSTTFRYNENPDKLVTAENFKLEEADGYIYSRESAPNSVRLERILSVLLNGQAITYSSGLSAFHAMVVMLNPKRIAIGAGYHGCHGILNIMSRLTGVKKLPLDCPPEELQEGDIIHIETPINPTGLATNLKEYADKAHSRGAYLTVDATFGPPGLLDPFLWGADVIMHSGTKYIGGHSDMLCGVLAVKKPEWYNQLHSERTYLGAVPGSLEAWLGIRSVRTLEIRVQRQSYNAEKLVSWLNGLLHLDGATNDDLPENSEMARLIKSTVDRVEHASLQKDDMHWLRKQMPNGFGPVFAIWMKEVEYAKRLPSKLKLFHHATSLGGVESLIEWRAMSDPTVDRRLMRVSVGIEGWEDLKDDLAYGFREIAQELRLDKLSI